MQQYNYLEGSNMKEIWKPCKGFEEFYEVSNTGHVRSIALYSDKHKRVIKRKHPVIKAEETTHDGYKRVLLCLYGVHHHCAVHRLVAQTFIPNIDGLPEVNHKDENTQNNSVGNLEWCSRKYNANYGTHPKRIKERMRKNHPTAKPVIQFDISGNKVREWKSQKEAARYLGIRSENISRCCKGKNHQAAGYYWHYAK